MRTLSARLRAHADLHPESAELLREAADELDRMDDELDYYASLLLVRGKKP